MIARVLGVVALSVAFVAGCTSTVVLGTLGAPVDGGNIIDFTAYQPLDMADGGGGLFIDLASPPDGFDIGFGSDAAALVDLAQ